jgi:hypothetical protein
VVCLVVRTSNTSGSKSLGKAKDIILISAEYTNHQVPQHHKLQVQEMDKQNGKLRKNGSKKKTLDRRNVLQQCSRIRRSHEGAKGPVIVECPFILFVFCNLGLGSA